MPLNDVLIPARHSVKCSHTDAFGLVRFGSVWLFPLMWFHSFDSIVCIVYTVPANIYSALIPSALGLLIRMYFTYENYSQQILSPIPFKLCSFFLSRIESLLFGKDLFRFVLHQRKLPVFAYLALQKDKRRTKKGNLSYLIMFAHTLTLKRRRLTHFMEREWFHFSSFCTPIRFGLVEHSMQKYCLGVYAISDEDE